MTHDHDEEELTKPGRISGAFIDDHDGEGTDEVTQVDDKYRGLTSDGLDPIVPDGVHHDIDSDFDDLPTPPPKP